ncbi:MAG: hypothetical protein KC593_03325 [Myxococcales bacterium]|nr:hypothetical protein [Myxococcales bacterium]MCB9627972.1 hypothetical protein [Sandaracinaceae bacterium]
MTRRARVGRAAPDAWPPWTPTLGIVCALLLSVGAAWPGSASAQWRTDEGGLWGARRCQSRNLISAGLLLGASATPLLAGEEHAGVGLGLMLGGAAVTATGLALRIRLRGDPGRDGPHDVWPEDRCQARSLSIRGGVYLVTAIVAVIRLVRLPEQAGTPAARAVAALIAVLPPAIFGLVFSAIGLHRLRQLGPRPDPLSAGSLAAQDAERGLLLAYPFEF